MKFFLFNFLLFLSFYNSFAQSIKTKPYWQELKTDAYKGKQDDICFLNENLGWYCNGSGKIYKTENGGTDWKLVFEKKGTFFRCIGFIDSLTGFAGNIGTDYFPNVSDTVPLYKTTDGGLSWNPVIYKGPTVKGLCAIDIYKEPVIQSGFLGYKAHVFCGGRVGSPAFTMISHDNGNSFESKDMKMYCSYILDIKFFNVKKGIICAASGGELDKSHALILSTDDGGKSWKKRYESKRPYETTWKCSFPSRNVGYVTVQSYDTNKSVSKRYVAKTVNGGKSWKEQLLTDDFKVREFGIAFINENKGWVGAVPNGFETSDGGLTWQPSYMGIATNKIRIITKPNGEKTAMAIGVTVNKNKDVIENGADVIAAMRNAYAGGKWYRNFTFTQETKVYKNQMLDKTETWYEAMSCPGKLLIKFNTKDSKDGMLFENGKIHVFEKGEEKVSKPFIHDLMLIGFDAYFLKPYETAHLLDSLKYNLKIVRKGYFGRNEVFIVGAEKNDSISNQFWVDAENFYLVKMIYTRGKRTTEILMEDYKEIEGNKVATKITFISSDGSAQIEKYSDVKFPKELNKNLFDPTKFSEIKLE